jgi:cytochrome oxidase Cu insertion factor (SCO1/SenC/PrrC family)
MILRSVATVFLLALIGLNLALPSTSIGRRGSEMRVRSDVATDLLVGERLPPLELVDLDGRKVTRQDLLGHRVLLTFERSVDW